MIKYKLFKYENKYAEEIKNYLILSVNKFIAGNNLKREDIIECKINITNVDYHFPMKYGTLELIYWSKEC